MDKARGKAYEDLLGFMDESYNKPSFMKIKEKKISKPSDDELQKGIQIELEHTDSEEEAQKIAMDHLAEDPMYYSNLEALEEKEPEEQEMEENEPEEIEEETPKMSLSELVRNKKEEAPSIKVEIKAKKKR